MRIVATSDTHFPIRDSMVIPQGDLFIHAGDLMYHGFPSEWDEVYKSLKQVTSRFTQSIFVGGNHDIFYQYYIGPCMQQMRSAGIYCLTESKPSNVFTVGNQQITIGGCPYVTGLPNWAFNSTEENIRKYLFDMGAVDVLVSHSPAHGLLAGKTKNHWGLQAIRDYIDEFKPKIAICGHVHEGYGHKKYNDTDIYNVSMCDRNYDQVNKPMIIEL